MGYTLNIHIEGKANGRWEHIAARYVTGNPDLSGIMTGAAGTPLAGLPADAAVPTRIEMEANKADGTVKGLTMIPACRLSDAQKAYRQAYAARNPGKGRGEVHMGSDFEDAVFGVYIGGGTIASHRGYDDVRVIAWLMP